MSNTSTHNRSKVLIIHDNRIGHLNPAIAVSEMIEKRFYLQSEQFAIPTLPKRTVSIFKKLSHFPNLFRTLGRLYFKFLPRNLEHTDVIVCSGMPNLIYAAYLSQRFNIPLIYAGGTRKFNWRLIDWTITTIPEDHSGRQIIIPTGAVPSKITRLAHIPSNHEACLLIGGPTKEYPFTHQDFEEMIQQFVQFADHHQIQASVVCSRRTPALSEHVIQMLKDKNIELVNTYSKTSICDVLKRSEYIFVTEDSATMLSESIQTGRIVISICREYSEKDEIIQNYLDLELIQRKTIGQITEAAYIKPKLNAQHIEQIVTQQLAEDLRAKSQELSFYKCHAKKAVIY